MVFCTTPGLYNIILSCCNARKEDRASPRTVVRHRNLVDTAVAGIVRDGAVQLHVDTAHPLVGTVEERVGGLAEGHELVEDVRVPQLRVHAGWAGASLKPQGLHDVCGVRGVPLLSPGKQVILDEGGGVASWWAFS